MKRKFKCPKGKCLLNLVYPNSNANLACDCECHFSNPEDSWSGDIDYYIKTFPEAWKKLNDNENK